MSHSSLPHGGDQILRQFRRSCKAPTSPPGKVTCPSPTSRQRLPAMEYWKKSRIGGSSNSAGSPPRTCLGAIRSPAAEQLGSPWRHMNVACAANDLVLPVRHDGQVVVGRAKFNRDVFVLVRDLCGTITVPVSLPTVLRRLRERGDCFASNAKTLFSPSNMGLRAAEMRISKALFRSCPLSPSNASHKFELAPALYR
ncbi:hypothetical protein Ddc_19047 [Ditylenchus destructor]|nr:hypothetical protein Ddc_19047 [Ditylenchus destructor]